MKLGAGYPMGPFELADYVGLDTTKFILDGKFSFLENAGKRHWHDWTGFVILFCCCVCRLDGKRAQQPSVCPDWAAQQAGGRRQTGEKDRRRVLQVQVVPFCRRSLWRQGIRQGLIMNPNEIQVPAFSTFEVDFVSFPMDVHEWTPECPCVMRINRIINFWNTRCLLRLYYHW